MNTESDSAELFKIVTVSLLFHFAVIASLIIVVWLKPEKEAPPPIPFFEMISVRAQDIVPRQEPPSVKSQDLVPRQEPQPEQTTTDVGAQDFVPLPEPSPEPVKPQDIAPQPEPTPTDVGAQDIVPQPAPSMDMPDMDMPTDIAQNIAPTMDMPAVEGISKENPCFKYVMRINGLTMQNFNPPSGTDIASGTKSKVGFMVERSGEIIEVILKESSGNAIWDRLAVRAVQITKVPPFPPECTSENISVNFNFLEK